MIRSVVPLLLLSGFLVGFTRAEYDAKVGSVKARLKKTVPDQHFHIRVEGPFVIIGDESSEQVERRATGTVRWARNQLRQSYFPNDPDRILEIWLFKDETSYYGNTLALFGEKPDTPYGYYTAEHDALIMNIGTGGGTLVHELVHPFVEANFPDAPAWLNEGLGSLYEQCAERDGRIVGLTNWRLPGLQEAIRKGEVPSFRKTMSASRYTFYELDPGTNYAQSRYLLYYLQEKGLLRKYYREFRAHRDDDPTGYATLKAVLGREDMAAFQRDWESWILKLRWR